MSLKTNRLIVIDAIIQISNIKPFKNKWLSDDVLLTLMYLLYWQKMAMMMVIIKMIMGIFHTSQHN
jgi:hypothetical protein